MPNTEISRRSFLRITGLAAASAVVTACEGAGRTADSLIKTAQWLETTAEETKSPQKTPDAVQTSEAKSSVTPTSSLTPEPTTISNTQSPEQTPTPDYERQNWKTIQNAENGDTITLNNPKLSYILRFPGDNYLAIIEVTKADESVQRVYVENPNCQFDKLSEKNLLSEPITINLESVNFSVPAWEIPPGHFDNITAKVGSSYSIGVPVWLISDSFTLDSQKISCPKKESVFDPIKSAWKETVVPLAEKAYQYLKDLANK